jgi:hypothetical protein
VCDGARTGCRSRSAALVGWRSYVSLLYSPLLLPPPQLWGRELRETILSTTNNTGARFLPSPAGPNEPRARQARTNERTFPRPTAKPANAGQPLSQPGYSYSFSSARRLIEGGRRAGAPFFLESSFLHRPEISSAEHPRSTRSRRKGFFSKETTFARQARRVRPPRLRSLCFSPLPKGAQEPPPTLDIPPPGLRTPR